MGIRADDAVAGGDESLLGDERMLDAAVVANLEVVDDTLLPRKPAHAGALGRGLDILVRREVVRNERNPARIEHFLTAEPGELPDGDWRGDVVAQHEIERRHHKLARAHFFHPSMLRQDLLCHCHRHRTSLKFEV